MFDLVFIVTEIDAAFVTRTARLRLKNAFAIEAADDGRLSDGVLYSEPTFRVTTAVLEHRTPCLGFAIEEAAHVNVWKNRLSELGLPVEPWLRDLKRAVVENKGDDYPIHVGLKSKTSSEPTMLLGELRSAITVTPGQKIGYVTDVADTVANRQATIRLAHNADLLFIEAAFAEADAVLAAERAHLTTTAAGSIAREAAVRRVEPFHFSPRYSGQEERLLNEVLLAFAGPLAKKQFVNDWNAFHSADTFACAGCKKGRPLPKATYTGPSSIVSPRGRHASGHSPRPPSLAGPAAEAPLLPDLRTAASAVRCAHPEIRAHRDARPICPG